MSTSSKIAESINIMKFGLGPVTFMNHSCRVLVLWVVTVFLLFLLLAPVASSAGQSVVSKTTKNYKNGDLMSLNWWKKTYNLTPSSPSCGAGKSSKKCRRRKSSSKIVPSENEVIPTSRNQSADTADMKTLAKSVLAQRKKCKTLSNKGFTCQRLKLYSWLMQNFLDVSNTRVNPWVELVRNRDLSENVSLSESELMPENGPEGYIFNLLLRWGDPADRFLFHKYKEFVKSREVRVKIPHLFQVSLSPRTRAVSETGRSTPRIFWDPGFNLKLKFPFFKDELKVAISTGPAFLAGIGTGIVLLIIKSMFAPFIFGMKYLMYNMFWKEGSPWEMMRMIWGGGGGHNGPEPWESAAPPPAIEHYDPPQVHNQYDNHIHHSGGGGTGPSGQGYGWGAGDQKLQFSQINPILLHGVQGLGGGGGGSSGEGRRQHYFKSLLHQGYSPGGGSDMLSDNNKEYVPSNALQAEVENYDPFYSPLLSRIDSIFTHLGYHDEGCRERAVCSIYKFPVKYAPYSNLLSAQLSKHQTELKRPVTKSPRILRYFKYMKAAKDGQGHASCIDTYPNCDQDTDSVTNLPMITTFNQLSELMGAEATGPSGS